MLLPEVASNYLPRFLSISQMALAEADGREGEGTPVSHTPGNVLSWTLNPNN